MNTNQLNYFVALYEKRSLSQAAKSIPITHQGLSRSIASLETELGVKLFEPGEGFRREPTPYADATYEFIQKIETYKEDLFLEFDRITAQNSNLIRI